MFVKFLKRGYNFSRKFHFDQETFEKNRILCSKTSFKDCYNEFKQLKEKNIKIIPASYTCLLRSCFESNDLNKAVEVHNECKTYGSVTEFGYNVLITMYNNQKKYTESMMVFNEMLKNEIKPSSVTLTSLYKDLPLPVIVSVEEKIEILNIERDSQFYLAMITLFSKYNEFERAFIYLYQMKNPTMNHVNSLFSSNDPISKDNYYRILKFIQKHHLQMDKKFRRLAILHVHILSFQLYKEFIGQFDVDTEFFIELAKNIHQGYVDSIFIFKEMNRLNLKIVGKILNYILAVYDDRNELKLLYDIFKLSKEYNPEYNDFVYATLIRSLSKHDIEAAEKEFLSMNENGVEPGILSYNEIILGVGKHHKKERIMFYFQKLKSSGIQPTVETYTSVIRSLAFGNNVPLIYALFREMLQKNIKPTNHTLTILLKFFLNSQAKRETNEIFEIVLEQFDLDQRLYEIIILWFYSERNHKRVKELILKMKKAGFRFTRPILEILEDYSK